MLKLVKRMAISLSSKFSTSYKYIRNDAILSGLAVVGILALIARYIAPDSVWPRVKSALIFIWNWLTSLHLVSGWIIVIFVLISVLFLLLIHREYKRWNHANSSPDYLSYTTDQFYGLQWTWTWEKYVSDSWESKDKIKINYTQICPKCCGALKRQEYNGELFKCINTTCKWRYNFHHEDINSYNIDEMVSNQIHIKLRTNSYKEVICS